MATAVNILLIDPTWNLVWLSTGVPKLREQIALKTEKLYGRKVSADTEITVTSGATEALFAAIAAADPQGLLVMFDGEGPEVRTAYRRRLDRVMRATGADPEHQLHFLRVGSRERFLQINASHWKS